VDVNSHHRFDARTDVRYLVLLASSSELDLRTSHPLNAAEGRELATVEREAGAEDKVSRSRCSAEGSARARLRELLGG
jgi:hypothetical protein